MKDHASRWEEVAAVLRWWAKSWARPAGDALNWEQHAGRETRSGTGLGHTTDAQGPQSGGNTQSSRHQNIKETGAGT